MNPSCVATEKISTSASIHLAFASTAQKMKFSIKDFFSKCDQPNPKETVDLIKFTEEVRNGKLQFLCSDHSYVIKNNKSSCSVAVLFEIYHFEGLFTPLLQKK